LVGDQRVLGGKCLQASHGVTSDSGSQD
jgi:hypothetical protein